MVTSRHFPTLHPESPADVIPSHRPSRVRVFTAVVLVIAMGLLAAASVFASRPYVPGHRPGPGTHRAGIPGGHGAPDGAEPDPC